MLKLLIKVFGLGDEIVIGFDDHLERRRGKQIKAKGIYRDAVRSSDSFFVKASELRWMSFMLLTEVPFVRKVWALPFLTVLCPSERYYLEHGIRHRKLTDRARQATVRMWRWFPLEKSPVFDYEGTSKYYVWNKSWKEAKRDTNRETGIKNRISDKPSYANNSFFQNRFSDVELKIP